MLKLSSNVSDVFPKVRKLSFDVSECKPLLRGPSEGGRAAVEDVLRQGFTLVHYSAQRKHILWDTLGA